MITDKINYDYETYTVYVENKMGNITGKFFNH